MGYFANEVLRCIRERAAARNRFSTKTKQWSLRLPWDLYTQLSKAAGKHGVTRTEIVVEALRQVLPEMVNSQSDPAPRSYVLRKSDYTLVIHDHRRTAKPS